MAQTKFASVSFQIVLLWRVGYLEKDDDSLQNATRFRSLSKNEQQMAESLLYLLDTSALLAHFRQEDGWESVQSLFESENAQLLIASPTLTELGRRLLSLGATTAEVAETVSAYQILFHTVIAIDETVALAALAIGQSAVRRLPLIDALIAGAAQVQSAILVHRDEHMAGIPSSVLRQQTLIAGPLQ